MILFVAGEEANSQAARTNLAHICETHFEGRTDVEVVDVLVDHRKALQWRILLTPALLVFTAPRPARVTDTLDEPDRLLEALSLKDIGARKAS